MAQTRKPEPRPGFGVLVASILFALSGFATAYDLDPNSTTSIKTIAKNMATDMLSFYNGDQPGGTPGLLPDPYYWWEAGAMMGSLVEYWKYTGDDQFVNITKQGLLFQVGDHNDYMPINQTRTEGNDDQGFWGLAVMAAAEYNFPHPNEDQPQWLALAQAVFNTQAARWDNEHCDGGLRWQIFQWNNGYNYKNSISQACFFALGARLALFTGNGTYGDWAEKTWNWMEKIEFINTTSWAVYDGAHIETGCTNIVPYQFSYNAGGMILGAAAMYNWTESQIWKDRLDNLLEGVKVFFTGPDRNLMTEVACEPVNLCNLDQQSFKAYLSRWLAVTTQWAPHTRGTLLPLLRASAVAAAKQCVGGDNKRMCGLVWNKDTYDNSTGVGQQMAAMEVTLSCMIQDRSAPLTKDTGGTSKGDPGAGSEDIGRTVPERNWRRITAGDKAGAAILTALVIGIFTSSLVWIFVDETSDKTTVQQFHDFRSSTAAAAAALAAGGVAGVLHRKNGSDSLNEMSGGLPHSGENSLRPSEEKGMTELPPVLIYNVRDREPQAPRPASTMPRGWPHNPAMRGSSVPDPDGIYPISGRFSHHDFLATKKASNYSPDELSSTEEEDSSPGGSPIAEKPSGAILPTKDNTGEVKGNLTLPNDDTSRPVTQSNSMRSARSSRRSHDVPTYSWLPKRSMSTSRPNTQGE